MKKGTGRKSVWGAAESEVGGPDEYVSVSVVPEGVDVVDMSLKWWAV